MGLLSNGIMLSKAWFTCQHLPLQAKLGYLLELCRPSVHKRRVVSYLGNDFAFDSGRTPFVLLRYPQDIADILLQRLEGPIRSVLDIGGNIGQFSATLNHFLPNLEALDIFEANFEILFLSATERGEVC